jgi:hypothetical protein
MTRLYLMPVIGSGASQGDARRPKYADTHLADLPWGMIDYGAEPACMVGVQDIPDAAHTALAAEPDCVALPLNLDAAIGAQLNQVQNVIEALNVPAQWVQATHTYRQVARLVTAMFQFMQRLDGIGFGRLLNGTVTLNTRFNQLPQATRGKLIEAAQSMNFDTSSLSSTSTIRTILKAMADQWGVLEIHIGGMVL